MRPFLIVTIGALLIFSFFLWIYAISANLVLSTMISIILSIICAFIVLKYGFSDPDDGFTLDRNENSDKSQNDFKLKSKDN